MIEFELTTEITIRRNIAANPEAEPEWEEEEIPVMLTVGGSPGEPARCRFDQWDHPGYGAEFELRRVEVEETWSCLHCRGTGRVETVSEWKQEIGPCPICHGKKREVKWVRLGWTDPMIGLVEAWMDSPSGEHALEDALRDALSQED